MEEKNDYIQLPPMKKDTSADVVSFIWEYIKIPEEVRKKVKAEMDEIREHCRDSNFQRPDLYEIASERRNLRIREKYAEDNSGYYYRDLWHYLLGLCGEYVHRKSLKEMLKERKEADKFILVIDTCDARI